MLEFRNGSRGDEWGSDNGGKGGGTSGTGEEIIIECGSDGTGSEIGGNGCDSGGTECDRDGDKRTNQGKCGKLSQPRPSENLGNAKCGKNEVGITVEKKVVRSETPIKKELPHPKTIKVKLKKATSDNLKKFETEMSVKETRKKFEKIIAEEKTGRKTDVEENKHKRGDKIVKIVKPISDRRNLDNFKNSENQRDQNVDRLDQKYFKLFTKKTSKILQGLRVAQAAVTERWP